MESFDVIVVGAGLAGLAAARTLCAAGLHVTVLEAADAVGGRIRTDEVDGMLLDRGFQLLNPAYPALAGTVDLAALDLQPFERGVVLSTDSGRRIVADPFDAPSTLSGTVSSVLGLALREPVGSLAAASYLARVGALPARRLQRRADVPYGQALDAAHVNGPQSRALLEVFLAGVLAEDEQATSRRFVDLLLRSFVRAIPGLPARGMQSLPQQIADALPPGTVSVDSPVERLDGVGVRVGGSRIGARAVIVAAEAPRAGELSGIGVPTMRALTTFYHRADRSPAEHAMLHVDPQRRGPLVNTAIVSDVAPTYCGQGALIASTVLGDRDDPSAERAARGHAGRIYGVDPAAWEHVATYPIPHALPAMDAPLDLRRPQRVRDGVFVAGDHRDTASIQGALVSGRRVAVSVATELAAR